MRVEKRKGKSESEKREEKRENEIKKGKKREWNKERKTGSYQTRKESSLGHVQRIRANKEPGK